MASRKEQKERLREERLARERAAADAERRKRLAGRAVGGLLGLAALAAVVVAVVAAAGGGDGASGGSADFPEGSVPPQQLTDLKQAADAAGCTVRDLESDGANHVGEDVKYRSLPPHSGDHHPVPADDGAYTESPGTEHIVHSLEHGRVAVWFKQTVTPRVKGDLKALFDEDSFHLVLAPDEQGMRFPIAASAWTHVLGCPSVNEKVFDAIRTFRDEYRDRGPESVP